MRRIRAWLRGVDPKLPMFSDLRLGPWGKPHDKPGKGCLYRQAAYIDLLLHASYPRVSPMLTIILFERRLEKLTCLGAKNTRADRVRGWAALREAAARNGISLERVDK